MKVLRLLGLLVLTVVATAWSYVGVFTIVINPTFLPVLLFGAFCMFGFIVVALHQEVFE